MSLNMFLRLFALFIIGFQSNAFAGFTFGNLTQDGANSFNQAISKNAFVDVGTVPVGVNNLKISLISDKDVDIQVWDVDANKPIVGWNIGALIGSSGIYETVTYNGITISYSGYNGDGTGLGHENIAISGISKNRFLIKSFGYASGNAVVNYSWKGVSTVSPSGSGTFTSYVNTGAKIQLDGIIPAGSSNVLISLSADSDVDVELYDAKTQAFVVGYKGGKISSSTKVAGTYLSDSITWSGWDGRSNACKMNLANCQNSELGKEWIKISGTLNNSYIMKVFGYASGTAKVNYSWGQNFIYAGFMGFGTEGLDANSKGAPVAIYEYINGLLDNASGSGANSKSYLGSNIKVPYDGYLAEYKTAAATMSSSQNAVALRLSALTHGGGDVIVFSCSQVEDAYMNLRAKIAASSKSGDASTGSGNKIYLSGHSCGGGDVQDIAWILKDRNQYNIRALFMIDSAEDKTFEAYPNGDSKIPSNVLRAYNYFQTEWNIVFNFWITNNITAENTSSTGIENIKISNIKFDKGGSPHTQIDNDEKVWGDIISKIISDYAIFIPNFGTL